MKKLQKNSRNFRAKFTQNFAKILLNFKANFMREFKPKFKEKFLSKMKKFTQNFRLNFTKKFTQILALKSSKFTPFYTKNLAKKMIVFFILPLFFCVNFLQANNEKLAENERVQKQLNKKIDDLAVDIKNSEKKLLQIEAKMSNLSKENQRLENNAKAHLAELARLNTQNENLLKNKEGMQTRFASLIAQDFAYDMSLPQGYEEGMDGFIARQVLASLDGILKDEVKKLSKDYEKNSKIIDEKQHKIKEINSNLKGYSTQLASLEALKKEQISEINRQKTDRAIYAKKLEELERQQNELRKTLAELNIVKKEPEKPALKVGKDVKQIGSSYTGSLVKKYSGKKTIAPLENFSVKQRFGNFTDPIYNIKMFNENVILRSKSPDARVKSVFDGKIVFAKQTNLLQKVVIIEHQNGLHTIYAHLNQISPNIKVGKRVKKGEVLGRVKNDLTFEVTQEKFHINPLELISMK